MDLYKKRFEMLLALHCSPTISGIKPSNLISCYKKEYNSIPHLVYYYNNILNPKNIFLEILSEYDSYYLVLIYNKVLLNNILSNTLSKKFLNNYGYIDLSIPSVLIKLKDTLQNNTIFPHEIGVILGYPVDDIISFINNDGKNYKFFGYWKVYSNESKCRYLFNLYTNCRNEFCNKILSGSNLLHIINKI